MDDTEQKAAINYELLVEDALRTVVRGSLALVEHEGLPGESHFYITFQTTAEGVQMSETLKAANPNEMTIVLQHQFWDLHVSESHFSVTLSFSGVHHNLNIPFAAVTHFNDPSVGFGLQFSAPDALDDLPEEDSAPAANKTDSPKDKNIPPASVPSDSANIAAIHGGENNGDGAEIVSLDRFRKDPAPKK